MGSRGPGSGRVIGGEAHQITTHDKQLARNMEYKAIHRYADQGPRKIRLFADLIRGRNADEAIELLKFYHNRGAPLLEKVVKSALGNADDPARPDLDALVVSEAWVDESPMFKRIQP